MRQARTITTRLALCVALGGLITGGCDDGDDPVDGSPGGRDGGVTAVEGFDGYISAFCEFADRCEGELGPGFSSADRCRSWYGDTFDCVLSELFADLGVALTADEDAISECVAWIESAPCTSFGTTTDTPCAAVFTVGETGTGAEGDPCEQFPATCGSGLYCRVDFGTCAACTREGALGEDCSGRRCADDLRCDRDTSLCAAPAPNGGDCSFNRDCESDACVMGTCIAPQPSGSACTTDSECASDNCDGSVCGDVVAVGSPCDNTAECDGYRVCRGGVCADRVGEGESCTGAADCLYDMWCVSGTCQPAGTCTELPDGASCDLSVLAFCGDGRYCDDETGQCQPTVAAGAPCEDNDQCGDDARCDGGTCAALSPIGGPCTNRLECAGDARCPDMTCQAAAADGSPCTRSEACESDYCDMTSMTCAPLPACPPLSP